MRFLFTNIARLFLDSPCGLTWNSIFNNLLKFEAGGVGRIEDRTVLEMRDGVAILRVFVVYQPSGFAITATSVQSAQHSLYLLAEVVFFSRGLVNAREEPKLSYI
jgi:hypothetical protein